ncbi:hypothetical protein AWB72_01705 [Caballeronia concitans]|uniref:Uncharacterized protein n=2 Tax=Caballeronia concitans TaxID=1777133 RepID=A0A658QUV6_9BURK|nr:hypothetical protein BurMR1_0411 [Burkholderia sp. MR1]SAL23396.1 hypothetical protein AWB72_01705 [Caballeronia concitans]
MTHVLMHCLRAFSSPMERVIERRRVCAYQREFNASASERLEQIAIYARAGYFNMGYTVDAFHMSADFMPH